MLTPFPLVYCPVGMPKPACCPHVAAVGLAPGRGPDAVTTIDDGKETVTGGGGTCHGGGYQPGSQGWVKTPVGWWIQLRGHRPQDLVRLQPHPRVRRWVTIAGALTGHQWQIPVLIEPGPNGWVSALDGIWNGKEWAGGDLADLQAAVLAVANGIPETPDADGNAIDRATEFRLLAIKLLGIGQFSDEDLLVATGWLSESVMLGAVLAAGGREAEVDAA